jgi:hypothetical protein
VQLLIARIKMATVMAIEKVTKMGKDRAKKTAINTAAEKPSLKFHLLPTIPNGPNITKTATIEGTKKDTSTVITEIDILA